MRTIFALVLALNATAAIAQGIPPTVGGKPLVQIRSHNPAPKPQSIAARLQACLDIDDQTKERLSLCYDAIFPVQNPSGPSRPRRASPIAALPRRSQRLGCFNGFAERIPKLPQ